MFLRRLYDLHVQYCRLSFLFLEENSHFFVHLIVPAPTAKNQDCVRLAPTGSRLRLTALMKC